MMHKDSPYPFDSIPEENYYGEFRDLSNTIGPFVKKDKASDNDRDNEKSDDAFDEFSIFPKV